MMNWLKARTKRTKIIMSISAVLLIGILYLLMNVNKPTPIDTVNPVGVIDIEYVDTARSRLLNTYVWYPTTATDNVTMHEDNAVFRGFSAIQDAPFKDGSYPLIVLSHGSGGNRGNQGWLAPELARQGAIVVAANHLGSTSMDSAPETNILTWNRPEDISFLIDSVLTDPQLSKLIDPERIAVVGHSLGGYTTLAIGGAELSLDRFIEYCDQFSQNSDCQFYRSGNVDLTQVDRGKFEQDNRDERVSAIVVIDPAYARSFKPESLESMANILLIAPPVEDNHLGNLQVDYLAEQLALGENHIEMAGAHHFSYLPECKQFGFTILRLVETGGELLCWPEEQERSSYHAATTSSIVTFLEAEGIFAQ